jgi:hypothetical protein
MSLSSSTASLLLAVATLPSARAALTVTFTGNLGSSVTIVDNGPLDEDPAPWLITVGGIGGTPLVLDGYTFSNHHTDGGTVGTTHYFNSSTGAIRGTGGGRIAIYTSLSALTAPLGAAATADHSSTFRFVAPMFTRNAAVVTAHSYLDTGLPAPPPSGTLLGSAGPLQIDANPSTPAPGLTDLTFGWSGPLGLESFSFNMLTEADNLAPGVVNTLSITSSGQLLVTATPEPSGVLLPVAAFSAALTLRHRRRA